MAQSRQTTNDSIGCQRYNRRVPRACELCRQRKTKCSGDTPVCRQCQELKVTCHYPAGWREKMNNERLLAEVQEYESFLGDLRSSAEIHTTDWIKVLLEKHGLTRESKLDNAHSDLSTPQTEMEADPPSPLSSIGSLDAMDQVEEDHNRTEDTRATGYMGKSSEITWMQRLQREAEQRARGKCGTLKPDTDEDGETKNIFSLHTLNYHLDGISITVPGTVQTYSMPSRQLADRLLDDYLTTIHPFFPIISKSLFCAQYKTFFANSTPPDSVRPGDKWLAILNAIFAIAAKHGQLMNAPWRGNETAPLIYLTRARLLSMNGEHLFSHPDLQQVQVEGLMALYLLASNQINRAWRISALAVRSAIALGINLKNENLTTPNVSKEARYKLWWCIYSLELTLCIMTGRALSTLDGGYATPLPLPFEEDQLHEDPSAIEVLNDPQMRNKRISNVMASSWIRVQSSNREKSQPHDQSWVKNLPTNFGLCYLYYCDLTVITQEVLNKIYSINCVVLPWSEIEIRIDNLLSRFDFWRTNLPTTLDFTQKINSDSSDRLRCKLALGFQYYSARITLGRPCLCRRDARQNSSTQTFNHMMAVITLDSASGMIDLIPDEPDVPQLYAIYPWWCILRQLMQSEIVILLELSFGCIHMPEEEEKLVRLAKKCIRWFFAMPDHSARRAWRLCDSISRKLARGMNFNTDDIPSHPYQQDRNTNLSASHSSFHPPPAVSRDYLNLHPVPEADLWTTYFNLSTPDLMSSPQGQVQMTDSYFPCDPSSECLIRYSFPSREEDSREHVGG